MTEEVKAIELEQFTNTAMQIILHAGDARNASLSALQAAEHGKFEEAEKYIKQARSEITEAHKHQTDILQAEMRYEGTGSSSQVPLLFIHAQDTIMTIMTEVNMTEQMIGLYRELKELKK